MTITLKWWGLLVAVAIGAVLGAALMHNFAPSDQHQQIAAQQDTIKVVRKRLVSLARDSVERKVANDSAKARYELSLAETREPVVPVPVATAKPISTKATAVPAIHDTSYVPMTVVPQRVIKACGEYIQTLQGAWNNCEERAQSYQKLFKASQNEIAIMKQHDKDWHLTILAETYLNPAGRVIDPMVGAGVSKGFIDFMAFYDVHYRTVVPAIGAHLRLF